MEGPIDVMQSANFNCETIAELLTQDGNNNRLGMTPLLEAVTLGLLSKVKHLLAAGGDASIRDDSQDVSLLDAAALMGHLEVMRALLEHGVDVNDASHDGCTALMCAVQYGRADVVVDVIDLLSSAGADMNTPLTNGSSPLYLSSLRPDSGDMTAALLQRGAAADAVNTTTGRTPLHMAAERGNLAATRALLAAGADASLRALDGYINKNPLDLAARSNQVEVIRELARHGVDLDAYHFESDCTALDHAARKNHVDAIDALVEAGARVTWSPLNIATSALALESMMALLRHGAPIRPMVAAPRYPIQTTPLHIAARLGGTEGAAEAVDLLLRWGADETERGYGGKTPAEVVGLDIPVDVDILAGDLYRVCELLENVFGDRAWRRRGLLLLCLARHRRRRRRGMIEGGGKEGKGKGKEKGKRVGERTLATDDGCSSGGGAVPSPAEVGASATAARSGKRERTPSEVGGGDGGSGCGGVGGGGGSEDGGDFHGVVAMLMACEEEGFFRTIVKFL